MANTFRNSGEIGLKKSIGMNAGTATAFEINSAYVFEVSGDVLGIRFCSPVTQVNGSLLLYAMPDSMAGAPTWKAELRAGAGAGEIAGKPDAGGAQLALSDELTAPADDQWCVFTFANVSLTVGQFYWLNIHNTHALPLANYASWYYRGACDAHDLGVYSYLFSAYASTDGFATSGAEISTNIPTVTIKFNDASVMGFGYIGAEAHANDANYRGNRYSIPGKMSVNAIVSNLSLSTLNAVKVYNAAGDTMVSTTLDECGEDNGAFLAATELTGGTAYDYVFGVSGASTYGTIYNMVEAEGDVPADVKATAPAAYIDGTPGSFTVNTSKIFRMCVSYEDIPTVSAGGGLLRHPGTSGGLNG